MFNCGTSRPIEKILSTQDLLRRHKCTFHTSKNTQLYLSQKDVPVLVVSKSCFRVDGSNKHRELPTLRVRETKQDFGRCRDRRIIRL